MNNPQERYRNIERLVLSTMLRHESALYEGLDRLRADMFSEASHRRIFAALVDLVGKGGNVSSAALEAAIAGDARTEEAFTDIFWSHDDPDAFAGWCGDLANRYHRLQAYRALSRAQQRLANEDPATVIADVFDEVLSIDDGKRQLDFDWAERADFIRRRYDERLTNLQQGVKCYLDIGIDTLSEHLGIEPGHLVMIAGQTGNRKTTLALNMAVHVATSANRPVLYINAEMSVDELMSRAVEIYGGLNSNVLRKGLSAEEVKRAHQVLDRLAAGPGRNFIATDAIHDLNIAKICTHIRKRVRTRGIKVAFVDYVQRMEEAHKGEYAWQSLSTVTYTLKNLAQELGIVIVAVAQLNKTLDLAGSSAMQRDADALILIARLDNAGVWLSEEKLHGLENAGATHVLFLAKARFAQDRFYVPVRVDPDTQRVSELLFDPSEVPF